MYSSTGFLTGRCVSSFEDKTRSVCEINAWCPEELSNSTYPTCHSMDISTHRSELPIGVEILYRPLA